jgi:hypothetical protein
MRTPLSCAALVAVLLLCLLCLPSSSCVSAAEESVAAPSAIRPSSDNWQTPLRAFLDAFVRRFKHNENKAQEGEKQAKEPEHAVAESANVVHGEEAKLAKYRAASLQMRALQQQEQQQWQREAIFKLMQKEEQLSQQPQQEQQPQHRYGMTLKEREERLRRQTEVVAAREEAEQEAKQPNKAQVKEHEEKQEAATHHFSLRDFIQRALRKKPAGQ